MMPALKNLLAAIRAHEAPKGYGQIYGGAKGVPKDTDVSKLTLRGVMDFQQRMLKGGSKSTACGGYQFIRKTLAATVAQMGLSGSELWDADLQDRMALHLIENRGLRKFLNGQMTREAFADALAAEWASLPMTTGPKKGRSKYDGDGLNKSFHSVESILALVDALKVPGVAGAPAPEVVAHAEQLEPAAPAKPRGLLLALIELFLKIFKRRT